MKGTGREQLPTTYILLGKENSVSSIKGGGGRREHSCPSVCVTSNNSGIIRTYDRHVQKCGKILVGLLIINSQDSFRESDRK